MSAEPREVEIGALALRGVLGIPDRARGLVIFAHGSGSGRLSPRNNYVAQALRTTGLGTLLLDLLTPEEERLRSNVFDIPLLAERLWRATEWAAEQPEAANLPFGYFGASTGTGAALKAAADDSRIGAVVSRGGRPDLAENALEHVRAPTLLIVGSRDEPVIVLNQSAQARLKAESRLVIVPGATHLFQERGTLDEVVEHAALWFLAHLVKQKENDANVPG
jgi:putative phosphoribosyl transferase